MCRTRSIPFGLLVAMLSPVALPAQEAFQGSITYRMKVESMEVSMTMAAKGPWMRTVMEIPGMPGEMFMIINTDSLVARVVMPAMGMYMEMDLRQAMANAESLLPQSTRDSLQAAMQGPHSIEDLGTTDQIAGLACRNYRISTGAQQMETCVATGMGSFGSAASAEALKGASPFAGLMPDMSKYDQEFPNGMLPLRTRTLINGAWETIMEATMVDRTAPGDELFKVPPGLNKVDPPGA